MTKRTLKTNTQLNLPAFEGHVFEVFFSKKGFTNQCQKYAEQIGAELVDLKRLSQLFENKE